MTPFKKRFQTHWNGLSAQKRNRAILVVILLCVVLMWTVFSPKNKVTPALPSQPPKITLANDTIPIEDLWLYRSEQKLDDNARALENLQTQMAELKSLGQAQTNESVDALKIQVDGLKQLLEEQSLGRLHDMQDIRQPDFEQGVHLSPGNLMTEPRILTQSFSLSQSQTDTKTSKEYIPVGSFAKAILLNGLDASTATTASSNPLPVLMRLTSDAILPRQFKGEMKTCHVIAGAYGELSTTRVMMRLETITCTDTKGNIFESPIEGYVTGDDGRVGVLGTLRDDTNPLLAKSFAAGLLGGIGQGIADSTGTTSTSALGTVQTYDTDEIFKLGLGEGASSALDRLAQYYIDRAEQIYPVIQVAPGRIITLVVSGSQGLLLTKTTLSEGEKK